MAVHRTKQQKLAAQEKRLHESVAAVQFQYRGTATAASPKKVAGAATEYEREVISHLKKDLLKTGVTSVIMVSCLIGIYLYLRYNNESLLSFSSL